MGSPIAFQEVYKAGMEDFIVPAYEVAPFTTIQNRAKVTRSLKAVAGVERVHVKGINLLQNEFGPNGEKVFEASNKDARIRFIGSGWTCLSTSSGTAIQSAVVGDIAEIIFYGTGLNFLGGNAGSGFDYRATIDGGAEGANIFVTKSPILYGRNYNANDVISITSGLSLGWHTVRLRNVVANSVFTYGFEILNQRTDLAVYSGSGVSNGNIQGLSALATSAFNAGVVGTRGARVVKYIQNGVVSQAVQEVDATSKFLTNTDHSNEEVVRRINFREFGANRADDFSTLTGTLSNRAFTLDDGTTTLVGSNIAVYTVSGVEGIGWLTGTFFTLTFIGTGLDVTEATASLTGPNVVVSVDGVSLGNIPQLVGVKRRSICSGLPYGTHTVKFTNGSPAANDWIMMDFIVYQPKKPSIPNGAFEVADYNVMADFSGANGGPLVSSGVIRKNNDHEAVYVGTAWAIPADYSGTYSSGGIYTESNAQNAYVEYTFFGTGFDWRHVISTNQSTNCQIFINGTALNSSYLGASSITVDVRGGTFAGTLSNNSALLSTLATNVLNKQGAISGASFKVTGLPLGRYTVRFNQGNVLSGTSYLSSYHFDIITPIHFQDSSLKIGSTSLKSVTKYSPEKSVANAGPDLSKAKAWVYYDQVNNKILSSHNVSAVLNTAAFSSVIYFEKPFKNSNYVTLALSNQAQVDEDVKYSNSIMITATNSAGAGQAALINVVFFGELNDE